MEPILSVKHMSEMDRLAVDELGLPSVCLMENAGRGCAEAIADYIAENDISAVAILCGSGNNGGDGFVIARCLANIGLVVDTYTTCPMDKQSPDARINRQVVENMGLPIRELTSEGDLPDLSPYDLIIDALLGTGLQGAPRGLIFNLIEEVMDSEATVIAIDIPSGVQGETGNVDGTAIIAQLTLTMAAPKRGLLLTPGRDHIGDLIVVDIGYMPSLFLEGDEWCVPDAEDLLDLLPLRSKSCHKGDCGKVLVFAGSPGMLGAALLTAGSVLRSGAGMVKLACDAELATQIALIMPEVMTVPLHEGNKLEAITAALEWADALAIGPGLGRDPSTIALVRELVATTSLPTVLDADGLFAFVGETALLKTCNAELVITPHAGEFQALVGSTKLSHYEMIQAGSKLVINSNMTLLLKGAPSLTIIPDGQVFLNASGNSGMATAGSGDVLTGLVAGLLAQGASAEDAAILGAHVHGLGGDLAAEHMGERGMTAQDLMLLLPAALELLENPSDHDDPESCDDEDCDCNSHEDTATCGSDSCGCDH